MSSASVAPICTAASGRNATLDDSTITRFDRVHLGVAVSLGDSGLIVPVIKDAQDLSLEGLVSQIKAFATRARGEELLPDEVQGATFTITNPGAFGASIATPVINLPQVAILDLEAVIRKPVVRQDPDGTECIAIRSTVNLVLGWTTGQSTGCMRPGFWEPCEMRLRTDVARQPLDISRYARILASARYTGLRRIPLDTRAIAQRLNQLQSPCCGGG